MRLTHPLPLVAGALAVSKASSTSSAASTSTPGYVTGGFSTVTGNNLTFGRHYAILNLDLINGLVGSTNETAAGKEWIKNTADWIDTVHSQSPKPLSIFSRIYFQNARRPEIGSTTPFAQAVAALGPATQSSPQSQIYPAFRVDEGYDVVLQKTRYYAGHFNELEEILFSQHIDTVILSGIRTSGVILSTTYQLFDKNFKIYLIDETSIETPPDTLGIDKAIKQGIIPKLPADVITLKQAKDALKRSGPAIAYPGP